MSLKARLVASIVALVAIIVVVLSGLYLSVVLENSFKAARRVAVDNAVQVESFLLARAQNEVESMIPPPITDGEWNDAFIAAVARDPELSPLLENLTANSPGIVEGLVTGPSERILAASIESKKGQVHQPLPLFDEFQSKTLWSRLNETVSRNQDYQVVRRLGIQNQQLPDQELFTIRMIVSSVLLREQVMEPIRALAVFSLFALLASVAAAFVVSHATVRPFERIGEQIDRITSGELSESAPVPSRQAKELAAVETKLNLLGQQFHGARADAQQLRGDIGQLLTRLEEAVLLFGRDDRLVMTGGSAERLIHGRRWELMGQPLEAVFPDNTELGAFVQSSMRLRRNVKDHAVMFRIEEGKPQSVLVSIEVVEEFPNRERVGTLVTLREAEPRKQIESRLDVSTRLAAISRLTSGAAHEIKNPLNSIALHLEVLKSKLIGVDIGGEEIEVISREIRRLDRVVKSFLDFTRPVELELDDFDLAVLLKELTALVGPDASKNAVATEHGGLDQEALIRGDRDLFKQALLNVIVNGIQAMPSGGLLSLALERSEEGWLVRVRDEGIGIPPQDSERIYQLYFTTKGKGSGIGLAMTFQVVQLHGGTIDFVSEPDKGTEFRIHLPPAQPFDEIAAEAVTGPADREERT